MNTGQFLLKVTVVAVSVLIITAIHYSVTNADMGTHLIHRELFFIPILLASFWFGLKAGIITSLTVNVLYVHHLFYYGGAHDNGLTIVFQICIFLVVGILLGWLVDRQKKEYELMHRSENLMVLGRAASTIGYEIENISRSIKKQLKRTVKPSEKADMDEVEAELQNLDNIVRVLKSFLPSENTQPIRLDLNAIILERVERFQPEAHKRGFRIHTNLSQEDCLVVVEPERMNTVIDNLIENAMDVSQAGKDIRIKTECGGPSCKFSVIDQGPGIRREQVSQLFTPFFTTKPDGHGLALAVCRKIISDINGNIEVHSELGHGAEFTVSLPKGLNAQAVKARL